MKKGYNELEIDEIDETSGVDNPAQVGARAVIFKRHVDPLAGGGAGGVASNESNTPRGTGAQETKMTDKTPAEKELDAVKKQLDAQATELLIAKAEGSLSDAERALYRGLDVAGQESFRKSTPEQRLEKVRAASEQNPVVYTNISGEAFRKNDDPRLIAMAKQADVDRKAFIAEKESRERESLAKRAETELSNLPGKPEEKVSLLKALEAVPAEQREGVRSILKAANDSLAKGFEERGTSTGTSNTGAEQRLEKVVEDHAKSKSLPIAKAWDEVLKTSEGKQLYAEAYGS